MSEHMPDDALPTRFPSVRIWLCGPFTVEWVEPETGRGIALPDTTLQGRDVSPALSLFKLLLCQPHRQAHRDWIMEQFWPQSTRSTASHRLENIASTLRKLLHTADGDSLFSSVRGSKESGTSYQLLPYPHLWVDADALAWNVEQAARMQRFGDEALPFWQRAFALARRGPFLLDDPYTEWVQERRSEIEGYYRQCVHALSRLYLEKHGEAGKAEALLLLRTYWLEHKTDEDALRPLMELLGEQERFQEAEEYYQQLVLSLAESGPSDDETICKPDSRTQDVAEYLRAKRIQRKNKEAKQTVRAFSPFISTSIISSQQGDHRNFKHTRTIIGNRDKDQELADEIRLQPLQGTPLTSLDQFALEHVLEEGIRTIAIVGQKASWSVEEMHEKIDQMLRKYNQIDPQEQEKKLISRRDILLLLTGLPGALMGLEGTDTESSFLPEEIVSLCLTTIPACWSLVYTGGIPHVEKVLPTYLAHLTTVIQQSSRHRQVAANLASQGYKLANLLALQREDFPAALQYSQDALTYGHIANSPHLQVAALIEKALTFWYRKRYVQTLTTYQEALQLIQGVSPIIQGRVYVGLAEAYAKLEQEQEALRYMGLAQDIFPEHPELDSHFSYTHYDRYYLYLYKGLMYTKLHQPKDALAAYTHFHTAEYAARSAEIANREATAMLALGDLDECSNRVKMAVSLALSMDSDLRYSEAYDVWQGMRLKWPYEHKVKELTALFQK